MYMYMYICIYAYVQIHTLNNEVLNYQIAGVPYFHINPHKGILIGHLRYSCLPKFKYIYIYIYCNNQTSGFVRFRTNMEKHIYIYKPRFS